MQLYDFHARQYDPQIGRFWGIDPMDQFPSGYTGMGNDPANMVDPTGMVANGSGASGGYGTGYNSGGGYVPNPFGEWGHHGGPSSFALMYFDKHGSGGGGSGGGSTAAESAQGESNSTGNTASVSGKELPELVVKDHKPDWAGWGFEMVNKYGSSLGFDFNSYGDNVGVSARGGSSAEVNWYGPGGQANWFLGARATALETSSSTYRLTSQGYGFSPWIYSKNYPTSPYFNSHSFSALGKSLGYLSAGFGLAMDIRGMWIYKTNPMSPNAVHPAKASINTTMSAYGLFVNPTAPMLYFGVDGFYPGGWPGYMTDYDNLQRANQQILGPSFRLIPLNKL